MPGVKGEKIILGMGAFSIGETTPVTIGLTRGGGKFTVERTYRVIEADGDKGKVKGRITKDQSIAKLEINALEILSTDLPKIYPATSVTTGKFTGTADILDADYNTVKWTGKTKDGKACTITLKNAINLENINWDLVDKGEIVQKLIYEACYADGDSTTEPWDVTFATA